jgi:small subunit ribosomal protein S20
MPLIKSAKKAWRQNIKRRLRNLKKKNDLKKLAKKMRLLEAGKKPEEARKLLPQIYKKLDKAAKTGLIKKNKAARLKSKFGRLVNKIS